MNPFSSRCMTDQDWAKTKFFAKSEFHHPEAMGMEFIFWLEKVRAKAGVPMVVTSDHRTPEENQAVGGAKDSAHVDVPCSSVDIGMRPRPEDPNWNYSRWQIVMTARDLGCERIGSYANGSLHLDMTDDKRPAPRMWRVVGAEKP